LTDQYGFPLNFEVTIPSYTVLQREKEKATFYFVQVISGTTKWIVRRRFREFKALHALVSEGKVKGIKARDMPPFPTSFHLGNYKSEEFLENRRINLEIYFRVLATPAVISKNLSVCSWLIISETGHHRLPPEYSDINQRAIAVARAIKNYTEKDDMEISLKIGDIISLIEMKDPKVWRGKLNGKVGKFPASYVEIFAEMHLSSQPPVQGFEISSRPALFSEPTSLFVVKALYDFSGISGEELNFCEGDTMSIIAQDYDEWWTATLNGKRGLIPAIYVRRISTEKTQFDGFHQRPNSLPSGLNALEEEDMKSWQAKALCDYDGSVIDEVDEKARNKKMDRISFKAGEILEIVFEAGDNWYYGSTTDGKAGMIPADCVQFLAGQ